LSGLLVRLTLNIGRSLWPARRGYYIRYK